jgi:hypothetical protein
LTTEHRHLAAIVLASVRAGSTTARTARSIVRNIELFDAYAIHIFATLHDAFPLPRRIDPAALVKEIGIKAAKGDGEMHLANVAQGTVNWLHATGFLFRDDPSDQRSESTYLYVLSPRAFEALQLKLPDVLRKTAISRKRRSAVRSRNWRWWRGWNLPRRRASRPQAGFCHS